MFRSGFAHAVCRAEQTYTQSFCQDQFVAGLAGIIGIHLFGVHKTGDGQTIFYACIGNGMTACQASSCFGNFFCTTAQDLPQNVQIHTLRKADQIQRSFYLASHGIDITQGIGSSDLPEGIRVVHHWRKKVHRLHQRNIICYAVHGGIIPAVVAHQQVRVFFPARQFFQNAAQHTCSQLCSASAAGTEHDSFFFAHARSPFSKCVRMQGTL